MDFQLPFCVDEDEQIDDDEFKEAVSKEMQSIYDIYSDIIESGEEPVYMGYTLCDILSHFAYELVGNGKADPPGVDIASAINALLTGDQAEFVNELVEARVHIYGHTIFTLGMMIGARLEVR